MNNSAAHVVVVTFGSAGDLFPFLRLGIALRQRGYRVSFLAPDVFAPQAAQAGLDFHPLPADQSILNHPDLWDPRKGFGVVWRATRAAMRELLRFVDSLPAHEPAALIAHPLALAHADLCRAARPALKVVAAYLAPSNLRTVNGPLHMGLLRMPAWAPRALRRWLWRQIEARVMHPAALGDVNLARGQRGLAPIDSLLAHWETLPDLTVTLFPDWFGPAQPDWPRPLSQGGFALYDAAPGAPLGDQLQAFLATGPAPLVFTHGSANRQAEQFFTNAIAAARALGRRAVLLSPQGEPVLAALSKEMLWQEYVPLRQLLPRVAALIHHGGIGTTAEALRAGIPQLVVPMAYDQFDNGARVVRLHAGRMLAASRASVRTLSATLAGMLDDPAIAAGCRSVQTRFSEGARFGRMVDDIHYLISKTRKN